jgi:dolichyl-phosphate-mannose--protein O-mannosyl transferase
MYKYHSELKADHPFTSKWYTWPIIKRPLWFYAGYFDNGDYGTIACMGNPAIWWLSIITAIFTFIYSIVKKNKEGLILIIMILATWITYALIGRIMFIYHFFITLPFMMLTIVFMVNKIIEYKEKFKIIIPIFTVIFLLFFIYFYPVYSGMPVTKEYIENTQWLDSWYY